MVKNCLSLVSARACAIASLCIVLNVNNILDVQQTVNVGHKYLHTSINQSINRFITRHSTEVRATMSLSQTEKECLNSVLENVNGWSSRQLSGREFQSLGAATEKRRAAMSMLCGERKEDFV